MNVSHPIRVALLLLGLGACADNPYVIGAVRTDAAVLDPCVDHPGALACSGFEHPELSDWPEPIVQGSGEIARSTARARSGAASLRAASSGTESSAVVVREFEPRTGGTLHLRVWLYLPGGVATETMNLFFLGDDPNPSEDPAAAFLGTDLNLEDGALQLYSPQSAVPRVTGTVQVPRDRWFCLRAAFVLADEGAVRVFVDGAPALEVDPHDTLPEGGVHLLRAGVDWSSGQTDPFEVFMDDLVLSDTPVPCSAP